MLIRCLKMSKMLEFSITPLVLDELIWAFEVQANDPSYIEDCPDSHCESIYEELKRLRSERKGNKPVNASFSVDHSVEIATNIWGFSDMDWANGQFMRHAWKVVTKIRENPEANTLYEKFLEEANAPFDFSERQD